MAINFNKVILAGHLTQDPECRTTATGTAVTRFRLAVNTVSGQGQARKATVCYVDVTTFGHQAETVAVYLSTGSPVMLEGRLDWQTWVTRDGQPRGKHAVIAERVNFLSPRRAGSDALPQAREDDPVTVDEETMSLEDAIPW